ncbi:uncharacterized protein BDZ99DRAFT_456629 [Mytilinidion resinicola]|uniref:RNA-binding domain-containing protein n=1 Tax=Mytilinidion resinicola TaxID=574789 RepID=A0A6A6Z6Y3_9PEZI|nr:uncharacterized protein BDZ99DRAFT_456629 [Mytilinidion resinicola]KAF2816816.1 hypothetical protein BDZ99DRAFT_456629 [Mytilinidion resinicola]
MTAVREKSFRPDYVPPTAPKLSATAPTFNPPTGPAALKNKDVPIPGLSSTGGPRKRTYNDREPSEPRDGRDNHYGRGAGGNRTVKQMRRGGFNGRGGFGGSDFPMGGMPGLGSMPAMSNLPNMPMLPTAAPGFPPFDPNNPMAALMAMQAMGFPMPGMPQMPLASSPPGFGPAGSPGQNLHVPKKERCSDYDTKGFCARGSVCPYEHGVDHIVVPPSADEYDPNKASLAIEPQQGMNGRDFFEHRGRGRGRGRGDRGTFTANRGRAPFSFSGPLNDRSSTTIVVEQIPEEKFEEQQVREFFSEFGNIVDIQMQAYKRLAIVKFDDHFAAKSAYDSPKVIFDNRFVKVYWYKPDSVPTPPTHSNGAAKARSPGGSKFDEEMIDAEEIQRKQAEAQTLYEEKAKKRQEIEEKRKEAEALIKKAAEEKKRLLEKLAAKQGTVTTTNDLSDDDSVNVEATGSKQDALQAKLAELQAEAEGLGLDPDDDAKHTAVGWRGRGRGTYRGRGYGGRGRGYAPSYRGRGGFTGAPYGARGGVKRLDNRPRRVSVAGVEAGTAQDEALRQYLLNNFDFESIQPHPDRQDAQVVVFKERYIAEGFIGAASKIPNIGHVELSWVANPPITLTTEDPTPSKQDEVLEDDTKMEEFGNGSTDFRSADMDYDVADDEDPWMNA